MFSCPREDGERGGERERACVGQASLLSEICRVTLTTLVALVLTATTKAAKKL